MRRVLACVGMSAVVALALISPPTAAACSCLVTPLHSTEPSDGERDVALNQALALEGVFDPLSIRLEDESGKPVEFELNAGPWPGCRGTSADVIPKVPLTPNTRYTLRVDPLYPTSVTPDEKSWLSFTTGTAMLPDVELDAPTATATVLFDGPAAMCGVANRHYTCLGIEDTRGVELILRRGDEVLLRTTTLVQVDGVYGAKTPPDCAELRRRAPTGKRSAPVKICGDALKPRAWVPNDSVQQVVQCRNGVIGQPAGSGSHGGPLPETAGRPSLNEAGPAAASAAERAAAGGRADGDAHPPQPSAAEEGKHHSYGCAATSGNEPSAACLFVLLALALWARRRARA